MKIRIIGCRAWNNADDGIDVSDNNSPVIIKNCWSWKNGFTENTTSEGGDGSGFKLGWTNTYDNTYIRFLNNNVAVKNRTHGFSTNNLLGRTKFINNTAWANGDLNTTIYPTFGFYTLLSTSIHTGATYSLNHYFRNNIAFGDRYAVGWASSETDGINSASDYSSYNSWNGFNPSTTDFQSTDYTQLSGARQSDGSLPNITFLHPIVGKWEIGSGLNGANIGAF